MADVWVSALGYQPTVGKGRAADLPPHIPARMLSTPYLDEILMCDLPFDRFVC